MKEQYSGRENLLAGLEVDEVNIQSAEALTDEINDLKPHELSLRINDINAMVKSLRDEQNKGIDVEKIRVAIAKLTLLRERAEDARSKEVDNTSFELS